ncbi:GDSL-type esterase/lipase family protein [Butyrivibrio fibrisolvens]|uniref:Lysophospholipase n=1 Tax=Butyrivibrio fibrisolvens TaxID=831 RepID=A0A317G1Q6_BUTFI|nr:GDSL-type esterase/lipase family protein [Butyrivibrio fibrisolvens]PWT27974.1 lysophospholipase [Butyrivibrio fibrisolvens]
MKAEEVISDFFQNEKRNKVVRYRHLNRFVKKGQILFTGSSLMEQFPINEILQNHGMNTVIYNRGIGGYTIPKMLESMEEQIFELEPSKIFINIGTNDISRPEETTEQLISDYRKVLTQIKDRLPQAKVYMMAYYPVNVQVAARQPWPDADKAAKLRLERLDESNKAVSELAQEFGYSYIDVNNGLTDDNGQTKEAYSIDGIHMWSDAYEVVFENMKEYITEKNL